ncbi:MAG: cation-translocating P-type ATPase, partial [Mucilaginibacter sp.]
MKTQSDSLEQFWSLETGEVLELLSCNPGGLDEATATVRLKQYGANTITVNTGASTIILFLSQFKSPVTLLLVIAAILSAFLGDATDTIIILIIVLISGLLGFWQEKGAANAVKELLKLVRLHCRVLRDEQQKEVPVEIVVPGDIIALSAGDIIPADSLIINTDQLFVDEAAFTGETYPVEKHAGNVPSETVLAKRSNILLMGSHVVSGKATAVVVNTGMKTEFGKISSMLRLRSPETDFEHGIRRFGYLLMEITLLLVIVIFAINVLLHKPVLDSFLFSLALSVGLTPQLLPAIISVNLATGARRMAKQQVIVKRLSSIENFGSMNILCSDKTGTITEGKVMLKDCLDINGIHNEKVKHYAWLNASLQQGFHNPIDEAICSALEDNNSDNQLLNEVPYDFIRKRLTIQVRTNGSIIAISKGAFKSVLAVCTKAETPEGEHIDIDKC